MALDADLRASVLEQLGLDLKIWEKLKSIANPDLGVKLILKRHCLQQQPCLQLAQGFAASAGQWSPKLQSMLSSWAQVNAATQIVEDVNGYQKNESVLKACRRFRKPSTLIAVGIEHNLIAERHRYEI